MGTDKVHEWKHGWVPLTAEVAARYRKKGEGLPSVAVSARRLARDRAEATGKPQHIRKLVGDGRLVHDGRQGPSNGHLDTIYPRKAEIAATRKKAQDFADRTGQTYHVHHDAVSDSLLFGTRKKSTGHLFTVTPDVANGARR